MFVIAVKNNRNKDNTYSCALVEYYRDGGVSKHRVLINFGLVDAKSVPFLKAAFAKKKRRLVYNDEQCS